MEALAASRARGFDLRSPSRLADRLGIGALGLAAAIIILLLIVILGNVTINGIGHVSVEFLTQEPKEGLTKGGIFPAIFGTFLMVLIMTLAAVPLGVATAVYLHEYTPAEGPRLAWMRFRATRGPERWTVFRHFALAALASASRTAVVNLAGVPSIVFGLFGLGFFIQFVGRGVDRFAAEPGEILWGQPGLLWAALTMTLLTLPTVIVATEEALRTVPQDWREASLALGATRWETIRRVVLPSSLPGILTGTILAVSRGAGEVAPILFTGAAYYLPFLPNQLTDQFMHLGYHIYILSTQSPDVEATKPLLYATVFVLLVLTFLLNLIAVLIRARTRARMRQGA